ncbi:phospholipase C [Altererythrobacter atlanticus]|uniref:phospholipase C n=1 Tax=Croceibacterium atlanticum TaxID=1267766 RepID=A0A0F7KRY4_9SPHN|nr:phospholipase C, phosphocholine-specific [Croceibacterium atlanticum]AKH43218.1 Non-hemolytic phospholipase C precursor [Croceibacterium atlanticum]MBB5732077.1 phospholipase C [Croceibacterium atlanticum]
MQTRRSLLKNSVLLAGAAGASGFAPSSIQRAMAITPDPGTSYLDAEHIVILMQENRSFDHLFGTLRGVRGFNDRRTIRQGDGASVFIQRDRDGQACLPWRVSLTDTHVTWMGDTPHARSDHLDAWNGGTYNNWVSAKTSHRFPDVPLTLAYHTREDLPFYYALADAFTVCDQNFAGSLTETAPNRLFMWSGTVREPHETGSLAYLKNGQTHPGALAWTSFPERLEKAGVSWKCYQNDSYCESPLSAADANWLGNDGDNTMERFAAVKPRFSPAYKEYTLGLLDTWQTSVRRRKAELERRLMALPPDSPEAASLREWTAAYAAQDARLEQKRAHGTAEFEQLNAHDRAMHSKVFTTNSDDPHYRELETIHFDADGGQQELQVPRGDVLHQFRQDAERGTLPTVSWLVAAANFSAHPGRPLYGAWYVSEVMDILTANPELWKKTIFIVTFDENDGFFDHVPPFVACDPRRPETGKVSDGLDPAPEYAYAEDERIQGTAERDVRDGPIGLGYRVPLIVASPWSRGGWVNSQLFDHSSIIRFVEHFVEQKHGRNVRQEEISTWRRAISGDLTSCFQPARTDLPQFPFLDRDNHVRAIERARFKPLPRGFQTIDRSAYASPEAEAGLLREHLWQEEGIRPACPLPYELAVEGRLCADRGVFELAMTAGNSQFAEKAAGAPFNLYLHGVRDGSQSHQLPGVPANVAHASYAVKAGDTLRDEIDLGRFAEDIYDLEVYGPNGFFRQFRGASRGQVPEVACSPGLSELDKKAGLLKFLVTNPAGRPVTVRIRSSSYFEFDEVMDLPAGGSSSLSVDLGASHGWYDLLVTVDVLPDFLQRYAGRVETGLPSISDPLIGLPSAAP